DNIIPQMISCPDVIFVGFFCTHSTNCKQQPIGSVPFLGLCSSDGWPFPLLFCNVCYIWLTLSIMSIGEGLQFPGGKSLIREFFLEVQSMMASRIKKKE
ncbi:MAG: hypothetical protein WB853_09740, partial [Desulfobacterales bacterium]